MNSLKQKTISSFFWSSIDQIANTGLTFLVGIFLARQISPKEFGVISLTTFFLALSDSLINSGFSTALIRKNNCTNVDYSTIFYFNIIIAFFSYFILYFFSPLIASFFYNQDLVQILRILGIVIIIDSFSLIQKTILTKNLNFKLQTRISVISTITSGFIALILAYHGFGIWSLVFQKIISKFLTTTLLWFWNSFSPLLMFSKKSFFELFNFGSKILASGLLYTTFSNLNSVIIGKYFSTLDLGYFTKSQEFANLPSQNLNNIVSRVSLPVLSMVKDDDKILKQKFEILLKSTMFLSFIIMFGLAAMSESLILTLIGDKWIDSILLLQLLCFVSVLYPIHSLNLNLLNIYGRSDLFLKLEIIKIIISFPIFFIGIFTGIKYFIIGIMIVSFSSHFINSFWSWSLIKYSSLNQLKDIFPSFIFSLSIGSITYLVGKFIALNPFLEFSIQVFVYIILLFVLGELTSLHEYKYLKNLLKRSFIEN